MAGAKSSSTIPVAEGPPEAAVSQGGRHKGGRGVDERGSPKPWGHDRQEALPQEYLLKF